jgi:hypothetical protein
MKASERERLVVATPVNDTACVTGVPIYPDQPEQCQNRFLVSGYHDKWAAVLFVASFGIVAGLAISAFATGKVIVEKRNHSNVDGDISNSTACLYLMLSGLASVVGSLFSMTLMHKYATTYIKVTNWLVILMYVALAIVFATTLNSVFGALLFSLCALCHLFWFTRAWRRIPLAGLLLRCSTEVAQKYPATIYSSIYSVVLNYLNLFVCTAVILSFATINTHNSETIIKIENSSQYYQLAGVLLVLYWTNQVILNVVHVTVSGVAATMYFMNNNLPQNPTLASFKRAMTTSFGSICLGSLIVAILQLLHTICRALARSRRNFLGLCALCLVQCLERLVRYFNHYAFTYVAIYGVNYVEAAKRSWNLISTATCATIFNDALVYSAINMTVIFWGLATAGVVAWSLGSLRVGVMCGLWSLVICMLILRVLYVGVVTMFVCVAEAPNALEASNPALHAEIMTAIQSANTSTV